MEGNRYLDQSLQELAIRFGSVAPNIFENLVGFEELAVVQQLNTTLIGLGTWIKGHYSATSRPVSQY